MSPKLSLPDSGNVGMMNAHFLRNVMIIVTLRNHVPNFTNLNLRQHCLCISLPDQNCVS